MGASRRVAVPHLSRGRVARRPSPRRLLRRLAPTWNGVPHYPESVQEDFLVRVALVGAGFIAGGHAAAAGALPDVELVAVTDRDGGAARRFAATWGVRVAPEVADLL